MSDLSHHVLLLDAKLKRLNAGPKARLDTAFFLKQLGFRILTVPTSRSRYWQRLLAWAVTTLNWVRLKSGDIVWCQFPVDKTTQAVLDKARRKGLKTVAFVHDIEGLKPAAPDWELVAKEAEKLKVFTQVLGLNEVIGEILQSRGVSVAANLHLWDYVCATEPADPSLLTLAPLNKRVVFAGSLAPDKSPFIYQLAVFTHLSFELYGQGWDSARMQANKAVTNVRYQGSFAPESPPFVADGAIGLVWDGAEINICGGNFGAYLAFNTPHKASMYLSRGLPVAVWKDAAIAPLIERYQAGMLIASLQELETRLVEMTYEEYATLAANAAHLGRLVRSGHFVHTAVSKMQQA
jgi:hypothetical protein